LLRETLEFALKLKRPYAGTGVAASAEFLLALPSAFEDDFEIFMFLSVAPQHCSAAILIRCIKEMALILIKSSLIQMNLINAYATERKPECLGADCAAGVALMVSMIHARVPGYYVFHDGEEQGCLGSRFLARRPCSYSSFDEQSLLIVGK
jgi:hypothetical protein